ncbi:MAG: EamA family transporter [Clostridia bacterium]|nr:EamA family transporter [Clostridia bacterium]
MKTKAFLYIIAAGILWGTSGVFAHYLAPYGFSSLQMTAVRGTVSCICMLGYVLLCARGSLRINPTELLLFAGCGLSLYGTAACYFSSMQLTSISTAVVLMYTAPVPVMIFSVAFLGERLTWRKLISVICMLVGCALVSGIIGGLRFDAWGIVIGAMSGVSYAAYNVLTKIAMQRGCNPLSVTVYSFLFMSVLALIVAPPWEIVSNIASAVLPTLPLCIGLGVVTHIAPYFLYTLSLKDLPAGTASALSIVEPMAATLFSFFLLGEQLAWTSAVGIALILLATVLLGLSEKNKLGR